MARRFPPPWSAELQPNYYVVRDANKQQLAYVYYENEPARPSVQAAHQGRGAADCGEYCKAAGAGASSAVRQRSVNSMRSRQLIAQMHHVIVHLIERTRI